MNDVKNSAFEVKEEYEIVVKLSIFLTLFVR